MPLFPFRSRFAAGALVGIMLLASSLAATAQQDLPSFPGDGRDTSRPVLTGTFTPAPQVPEETRNGDQDETTLRRVLDTQAQAIAKGNPDQIHSFGGIPRTVTNRDLARLVEAMGEALDSGRPLGEVAEGYLLQGDGRGNVRFTSYFTPSIAVSDAPSEKYATPLYRKPADRPLPLPTRGEITGGALSGQGLELAWTDNVVDLFFLQVQGSGYGVYEDGRRQLFSYGGKNGHPYVSIGKHLVASGEIPVESISMASIKAWFAANPERTHEVMDINSSYSFFVTDVPAVTGSAGVPATPLRTVAADSTILPLGSMILIEIPILGPDGTVAYHQPRIMAVQDRGGAIKGTGRIDIYAGAGSEAERFASHLKHFGRVWLLLPRG